jgi:hypothetical protein
MKPNERCENGRNHKVCLCDPQRGIFNHKIIKTPQIAPMAGMTPLGLRLPAKSTDEKTVAERKWRDGLKPNKPQAACDVGLFSDDSKQDELF